MRPQSQAKIYPDYIPKVLRTDYEEACLIRDLSPKASATLARRCLQGMIRDFFKVSKNTLKQEIDAISDQVDEQTLNAINAVRNVGNIGAHMERDINVIIDVDAGETQLLIELIEILFKEWYINRHERELRMQKVIALAESKKEIKEEKAG